MRILIYGAGVLGSHLTHVLWRGGNDVTLLARGRRLADLEKNGLVIRHTLQLRTTVDRIGLTDHLAVDDRYDLCFVVVQRQQLNEILPEISACKDSHDFVLVGNNPTATETAETIRSHSPVEKNLVFGFQSSGGKREPGRIVSLHTGFSTMSGNMTLGSLDGNEMLYSMIRQAFAKSPYRLVFSENMDAWLKCHAAFILPIVFACFYADGDLRRVARDSKMLNLVIDTIDDAYHIVKAAGHPIIPSQDDGFIQRDHGRYYWMLKLMMATPIGKLAASNHAMSAPGEMHRLYEDFYQLKQKAGVSTPAWDEMAKYMEKY
jgi:2-dehydropantoate 2-reductase